MPLIDKIYRKVRRKARRTQWFRSLFLRGEYKKAPEQFIGSDQRIDVRWNRFGFMVAKYYRGRFDGRDFEKTAFKTRYGFNWKRFLMDLDISLGFQEGMLQRGLKYTGMSAGLSMATFLFRINAPDFAQMLFAGAIALDGSVVSSDTADTVSVTVAANSNRMLIVTFGTYQGNDPSGITHSGSAMTELVDAIGSFGESSGLWGRVAPASGTANVVVSGAANYRGISIYSLYNVDQTLPATTAEAGGDSNTASVAITPTVDNCWIIWSLESEPVPTMTTSSGVSDAVQEGETYQHVAASHFIQTTAASKTGSFFFSY